MNKSVALLEPTDLWGHFVDLNAVPRPSKREERVIKFVQEFGAKLGLPTETDATGNIIIRKPASPGKENRPTVALQSHLDMVHQKNADTAFDFDAQGIAMDVEGDWVKARGTTLGADNGIGVAAMMALLADKNAVHPPLEALFTIDEETGMTGAKGFEGGRLQARYLLNLDTEDDDELTIGCAGGVDVVGTGTYESDPVPPDSQVLGIFLEGLTGGHSGMDIHRGRANSNKLLNRVLLGATERFGLRIVNFDGGGLRNAIPREAKAVVSVAALKLPELEAFVFEQEKVLRSEYASTDPILRLRIGEARGTEVWKADFQTRLLRTVYALHNGIFRMSPDVDGLVQTSNNLARVLVADNKYSIQCLTRGSVDSEKMDLGTGLRCSLENLGAEVSLQGEYPGWTPQPSSEIVRLMSEIYTELFQDKPHVNACHAGLECGILGTHYSDVQMISFGPNIRGAHSPDETVQVSSVQKFWKFLTTTLERL